MKKIYQSIRINEERKHPLMCVTNIGQTKDVSISVAKDYLCVSANISSNPKLEDMLSTRSLVLSKALKRGMTVHILRYHTPISVKTYTCQAAQNSITINADSKNPKIYSMVSGKLLRKVSPAWSNKKYLHDFILSDNPDLTAAVAAMLISKTKQFETERFLYLWMAMNGLYRYYAMAFHGCGGKNDTNMLQLFSQLYGFGLVADEKMYHYDQRKVDSVILRRSTDDFLKEIKKQDSSSAEDLFRILGADRSDISAYGYYLLQHSYKYRCNMFHANHQVKLLSFSEESEILVLRTLSDLLEEFLDQNLHKWFDQNYLENVIKPIASGKGPTHLDPLAEE